MPCFSVELKELYPMFEKHNFRGRLIALEGLDGSGKSTQLNRVSDCLTKNNRKVVCLKQPTDTYRSNPLVRSYLERGGSTDTVRTLAEMSANDRLLQQRQVVTPALSSGSWVLFDRYVWSGAALFLRRGVPVTQFERLNAGTFEPDACIFLDVQPGTAFNRVKMRAQGEKKFEELTIGDFEKTRNCYLSFQKHFSIVDGEKDVEDVFQEIRAIIEKIE